MVLFCHGYGKLKFYTYTQLRVENMA